MRAVVNQNGRLPLSRSFHVRVLLPCYRESLDLIQATAYACIRAELPADCYRTVYICDDGKDAGTAGRLLLCCLTNCQTVGPASARRSSIVLAALMHFTFAVITNTGRHRHNICHSLSDWQTDCRELCKYSFPRAASAPSISVMTTSMQVIIFTSCLAVCHPVRPSDGCISIEDPAGCIHTLYICNNCTGDTLQVLSDRLSDSQTAAPVLKAAPADSAQLISETGGPIVPLMLSAQPVLVIF